MIPLTTEKAASYYETLGEVAPKQIDSQEVASADNGNASEVQRSPGVPDGVRQASGAHARTRNPRSSNRVRTPVGTREQGTEGGEVPGSVDAGVGGRGTGDTNGDTRSTTDATTGNATATRGSRPERSARPTQHFPLVPEPQFPKPSFSADARLTEMGARVLHDLWEPPNRMRDIEALASYFSVPPVVIHRELRELELIPDEFSGEKITVEWMLKDARKQRETRRESRERFLRDNEGRDVENLFQFEEWEIQTPVSSRVPVHEFVLDPTHPEATPVPAGYLTAEDEVRAQEIEKAIDAVVEEESAEIATRLQRGRRARNDR